MAHEQLKQYLLSADDIPVADKRFTLDFCKKVEYICNLNSIVASTTKEIAYGGIGSVNSNICLVFDNRQLYEQHKQKIYDNVFAPFNMSPWQTYITFVNKCKVEYPKKYILLANELYAIEPIVLYIIIDDINIYNNIMQAYKNLQVNLPQKYFHIPFSDCISDDISTLWQPLHYMINYGNIII